MTAGQIVRAMRNNITRGGCRKRFMMSFKGVLAMNGAGKTGTWALFAVLLALCPITGLRAQDSGTIRGRVVDSTTQQPIAGAQVQVSGSNRAVTTDASG
ncbi:MAG TPA: hypothetical protein VLJ83_00930, partial [Gemmatimonadaceae bacterium]|nr:hypothetical protein [Gemmatimonadaceae bacterium]